MTREEVIQYFVDQVDDWELDDLIEEARASVESWAENLSDEKLLEEYNSIHLKEDQIAKLEEGDHDGSDGS